MERRTTQCVFCGDHPANQPLYVMRHVQEKSLRCPVCKTEFHVAGNRSTHHEKIYGQRQDNLAQPTIQQVNSSEKPTSRPHPCPDSRCSYTAKTKSQFAMHLVFHSGQKTFRCALCSETFETSGELQMHLSSHTGLQAYRCPVCPEGFPTLQRVVDHLGSCHLGEKGNICGKCGEEFGYAESLSEHMKTCPNNQ